MFSEYFDKLKTYIPMGRPVIYFDYAVYGNVGDLLIHKATEVFFRLNRNRLIDSFNLQNYERGITRNFPPGAIIVFQGGGNFGSLFPRHDRMRLAVLHAFKKHEAVILPQTVYFETGQAAQDIVSAYNAYERLTLLLRDTRSLESVRRHATTKTDLMPDMAHFLDGTELGAGARAPIEHTDSSELHFMRAPWKIEGTGDLDCPFDVRAIDVWNWPEYLNKKEKKAIKFARKLHRWDRKYVHSPLPLWFWRRHRDRILRRALAFFSAHDAIHTNRLHGGLFGLLCDKRVVFYDTGYGKLDTYYTSWLKDDPRVSFAGAVRRNSKAV